jgi:hypothetical protein
MFSYCLVILGQRADQVLVGARDELIGQLDDGDLRAELVVDACHLQPDDPAADDEQPPRHLAEFQRAGGVDDPRVGCGDERQRQSLRSGRDDCLLEADRGGPALGQLDPQLVR